MRPTHIGRHRLCRYGVPAPAGTGHRPRPDQAPLTSGRLGEGDEIGTTIQLADTYVLSSSTILQAMDRLQADGLAIGRDEVGWYVTQHPGPRDFLSPP